MHNTVVIFSSNDNFTLKQVIVHLILKSVANVRVVIRGFFHSLTWTEIKSVLKDLSHWRSLILVETLRCLQEIQLIM